MRDDQPDDGQGGGDGIVLARIGDAFWLLEGEAHLDAMLTTTDGYPTPVRCIPLASMEALGALLPDYASLAIPLGLLLGTLFAFRQLSLSSELDVMRAVGLSYLRLLRVPYAITIALMAINAALVFYVQPVSKYF